MIDSITCIDLHLPIKPLLSGQRLLFPLSVDEQTGEILNGHRKAKDRGLEFTLIPSTVRPPLRCKLVGSLHKYRNQGMHNADNFTTADLAATLIELATTYQIDLTQSPLNSMEFGVNIAIPFPVSRVLDNLISYKNRLFSRELEQGKVSYECVTQRYVLKLYDKGLQQREQVPGLPENLLRVEMKVLKMEYLTRQGIKLRSLADLLDSTNYPRLSKLLLKAFQGILFDEPSIDLDRLNLKQQRLCLEGRDARTWLIPDEKPKGQRAGLAKQIQRREQRFRQLLATHRQGNDWVSQTAVLITEQWHRLTIEGIRHQPGQTSPFPEKCPVLTDYSEKVSSINRLSGGHPVSEGALTSDERGKSVNSSQKGLKLTPSSEAFENPKVSTINHLSIGLIVDTGITGDDPVVVPHGTFDEEERQTHSVMVFNQLAPAFSLSSSSDLLSAGPYQCEPVKCDSTQLPMGEVAISAKKPALARCCAVTGVDISHQNRFTRTVTVATLDDIRQSDADRFNQIVDQFCPLPGQPVAKYWQTENLLRLIQEAEQHPRAPRKRLRACPVTGIDTTHQPLTSPTLTHRTLTHLSLDQLDVLAERYLNPEQNRSSARIDKLASRLRQINVSQQNESIHQCLRCCSVTGIDITHQRTDTVVVGRKTLERMIMHEPERLDLLSVQLLTPDQQQQPIALRCAWLAYLIQQRYEQQRAVAKADY